MGKSIKSSLLLLGTLVACNNYGLDDKIKAALNGGGTANSGPLSLSAPSNQTILIQNKSNLLASLQFVATGGNQPYAFSFTGSNIPANFSISILSTGLLTINRNTSVGYPSTIQTSDPLAVGTLTVKVVDASGSIKEVTYPLSVHFKRAFITSIADSTNFSSWAAFSACINASPILAANCACQLRATAAGRVNAAKYRAWLSYTSPPVNAICNITNDANLGCVAVTANAGGPWYGTTGLRLADDLATTGTGLLSPTPLQNNLDKDEFGAAAGTDPMTGTDGPGTNNAVNHCTNWTSISASCGVRGSRLSVVAPTWTNAGMITATHSLYCFEAD